MKARRRAEQESLVIGVGRVRWVSTPASELSFRKRLRFRKSRICEVIEASVRVFPTADYCKNPPEARFVRQL